MRARMAIVGFLLPWVLIGVGVIFIAFSGGPGAAREAYLTRGSGAFRVVIPLIYIGLAVAVPAVVIASRAKREGNSAVLSREKERDAPAVIATGRQLFQENCAACHNLDAVNARGITGPDLDKIGKVTPSRVLSAIKTGGTGQNRMPANLLQGENAKAVADYVARVAAK
jgi:mono/diheme cytochrome c family protein